MVMKYSVLNFVKSIRIYLNFSRSSEGQEMIIDDKYMFFEKLFFFLPLWAHTFNSLAWESVRQLAEDDTCS